MSLGEGVGRLAAAIEARRGADPATLAGTFGVVEERWSRLVRRTDRIARGRTGPNIQQIQLMGNTLEAIRRDWPY